MTIHHAPAATTPHLGRYTVDTDGSSVTFRTRHMFGLGPVRGRFALRSGVVDVAEPIGESRVRVEVEVATFHTRNPVRDSAVCSAKFLDAEHHPLITFDSARLDGTTLAGELTAHGVTLPASFAIDPDSVRVTQGSFTAKATARIDRTEFGVTAMRGMAGRYLDVTVEVRCVKK